MNIYDCWPDPNKTPRGVQRAFFEWVQEQDARFIIAQVPVGGGKSLMGMTLSRWFNNNPENGNSFILTPQRILQSQYERDFDRVGLCSLYGRSNFNCQKINASCQVGHLFSPVCEACPYEARKHQAQVSPDVVLNYKIALLMFTHTKVFTPRQLMILDEAHTTEHHLVALDTVSIPAFRLRKLMVRWKKLRTMQEALDWIESKYMPKLELYVQQLGSEAYPLIHRRESSLEPDEVQVVQEWQSYKEHHDQLRDLVESLPEWINEHYVYISDDHSLEFKKLYARQAFNTILKPYANRFLFMSSTILNPQGFCSDLGINFDEAVFFDVGSEFPAAHRTVAYTPAARMSYGWDQDKNIAGRRRMANQVYRILERHKDESGIIHTGSFKMAKWIIDEIQDDVTHKIFHHNKSNDDENVNRNITINEFVACDKPAVLISPSSTEGLDLKDNLARFAIFIKVPFANLQDQWVKRRMELSNEWYQRQALINIIQGGGRIVRSKDDWGVVYILDESWSYLFQRSFRMIPKWWMEAYNK